MKRTLTINLSGLAFTIDEDAYDILQEYLKKLETHFPNEEDREILADIEQRIAEIFNERLADHRQVVNADDVKAVIGTLGSPDQIDDAEEEEENREKTKEEKQAEKQAKRKHRRFYRDTDNCILGGIASGLAAYLGMDVTAVRLLMVILLIFTAPYTIAAYLIIWIIAPSARTTSQKLEMQGIEPSIENMRKYVESEQFREAANRIGSRLGQFALWCFRMAAIVVGIFFGSIGIAILFAILYALIVTIAFGGGMLSEAMLLVFDVAPSPTTIVTTAALILICVTIPLVFIIESTICLLRRDKAQANSKRKAWNWVWFAVWVLSLVSLCTIFVVHRNSNWVESGNTYTVTERRLENEPFNSVSVSNAVVANLIPDSITYVEIMGNENSLRNTKAVVEDNQLRISIEAAENNAMRQRPVVDIHYKDISSIIATTAASVRNEGYVIETDKISISTSSAAKANIGLSCQSATVVTTSASDIKLSGDTRYVNISSSSASKVNAKGLQAGNATITAASGSNIKVSADTLATVRASSGAKIRYAGKPYINYETTTSGGSVRRD